MVSIFGILKSHNFIVDSPFSDRLRTARWVSPIPALIKAGMDICSTFGPGFSSPPGPKIVGSLAEKKRKTLLGANFDKLPPKNRSSISWWPLALLAIRKWTRFTSKLHGLHGQSLQGCQERGLAGPWRTSILPHWPFRQGTPLQPLVTWAQDPPVRWHRARPCLDKWGEPTTHRGRSRTYDLGVDWD